MLKRSGHGKAVDWYLLGVLIYEMLTGAPPYFAKTKEEIFFNIENSPLIFPEFLSEEAKLILGGLLEKNPLNRLGSGFLDVDEIKNHVWFKGVKWDRVFNRKYMLPRCIRPVKKLFDSSYQIITARGHDPKDNLLGWSFAPSQDLNHSF